jgi:Ser/Thr protein kinase RdoA (MazF antagonist)
MLQSVLKAYGFNETTTTLEAFGNGLIHRTWKLVTKGNEFILQRINDSIFSRPEDIAWNIELIADHLAAHHPDYFFVSPIRTIEGNQMLHLQEGYFRMFPFVKNSHSYNIVSSAEQAYEAARQFGKFTVVLKDLDPSQLKITIPGFHDLVLRYNQFLIALQNANAERKNNANALAEKLKSYAGIVTAFDKIKSGDDFQIRIIHHDTKINNVLFDSGDKGICVIDLDTVMPGFFFSDVGDMMRTYLPSADEEEQDFDKIKLRDFYAAIIEGYCSEMQDELSMAEKNSFFYAGQFMIYMQALRFLTDYLNNDSYYGARYPQHNLVRAENQLVLLERFSSLG